MSDDDFPFYIDYFGPSYKRKNYERQVDAPIGQLCILCEEAVIEGDTGTIDLGGRVTHHECAMRGIIGSVGHQMRRCSCYVPQEISEEDPAGMTRREAAIAAVALWEKLHK